MKLRQIFKTTFTLIVISVLTIIFSVIGFARGSRLTYQIKLQPKIIADTSSPVLSAKSVLVVDLVTDTILLDKDSNLQLSPASLTKLATALVVLDKCSQDKVITVPKISTPSGSRMGLFYGEKITVNNLIYGLLLPSGNDAANTLAMGCFGSNEQFLTTVQEFTQKLGMFNTQFKDPSGLATIGQYSTAKDLLKLAKAGLENKQISEVVATKEKEVTDITGQISHKLVNLNRLLENPQIIGIKTGTSDEGENLIILKVGANKKIVSIILESQNRFFETQQIFDWIDKNVFWLPVIS